MPVITIAANTTRPQDRITHVRETYHDELAAYLLSGDAFRVTSRAAMGDKWHEIFGQLVSAGYMRQTNTGRYSWQRYVARVQPGGIGLACWHVYDSLGPDMPVVRSGSARYAADAGQGEISAAWEQARTEARAALDALGRK